MEQIVYERPLLVMGKKYLQILSLKKVISFIQYRFVFNFFYSFLTFFCISACEFVQDQVYRWGETNRHTREKKIQEEDLRKWQSQLKLSREKSRELHQAVQEIVKEKQLQGQLSQKIANAFLQIGRYDLSAQYYNDALQNKFIQRTKEAPEKRNSYLNFEKSLRYFDSSLLIVPSNRDLFFEAGLAYANASRAQGWEEKRFRIAIVLFKRMMKMVSPHEIDVRPFYQLALLYGKTGIEKYKNIKLATQLLERVLSIEEKHIPARFALAHFLVEEGKIENAIAEYDHIIEILQDIHRKYKHGDNIPVSSYPNYKQAKENKKKLQDCLFTKQECIF